MGIYCKVNEICAKKEYFEQILHENWKDNTLKLIEKFGEAGKIYAEQLQLQAKLKLKLPSFYSKAFVTARSLEQCTSEAIAMAKAQRHVNGKILVLCGGIGADDFAFSQFADSVTSVEMDACLNKLVAFNELFDNNKYTRLEQTAEDFLALNQEQFDLVYIDPDRRVETGKKSISLQNYSPNVLQLLDKYNKISPKWLIKLSPAIDLDWLFNNIKGNFDIEIYTENAEVKEILLVWYEKGAHQVYVIDTKAQVFEKDTNIWIDQNAIDKKKIFIEASAAAIKAGFTEYWNRKDFMAELNNNQAYFQSSFLIHPTMGRSFNLLHHIEGSLNLISKKLEELGIKNALISSRDFGMNTQEIANKLKISDKNNPQVYLFFSRLGETKFCCVCEKI